MRQITRPLTFDDLPTRPPLQGQPQVSDDIQQTAALLVGYDKITRRLVYCNPQGVLHTVSPPVKGIINQITTGAGSTKVFTNITTTEVIIRANPANVDNLWVNLDASAAVDTGYPLEAGEWLKLSINNLLRLNLYFVGTTTKAIILYTV